MIQHLAAVDGVELDVRLEITAVAKNGFDEAKLRTISENAQTLKFEQSGFEAEQDHAGTGPSSCAVWAEVAVQGRPAVRCPNRHLVGRIIKHSVGSPLLLDMPKRRREDWKQVSERPMLTTHCGVCKRAVSKATDMVKERVDRLIDDKWEHKNQYVLPFLITSEDWAQTAYTAS